MRSDLSARSIALLAGLLCALPLNAAEKRVSPRTVPGIATNILLTLTTPTTLSYGQTVDGFAQVDAADHSALSGTTTFYDGDTSLCVIPVATNLNCPAATGTNFAAGAHLLTAVYSGDTAHASANSNAVIVTIVPAVTTGTLTASPNPATLGQAVTLTAIFQGNTATGQITFLDGDTPLGFASLKPSGFATLSTSALTAGTHLITATLPASQNFAAVLSAPVTQIITSPATTSGAFSLGASDTTVATGNTASVQVQVSALNGFAQPVQLSCSNLPETTSCSFSPGVVANGTGTAALKITTQSPRPCDSEVPYSQRAVPALAALLLLIGPRRHRLLKSLLSVFAMVSIFTLSGCGGACTNLGTRPGTYTIQITGSSAAVTISQKVKITITP